MTGQDSTRASSSSPHIPRKLIPFPLAIHLLLAHLWHDRSRVFPRLTPPITHQTDLSQSTSNNLLPPNSTPSTLNTAAAIPIPPSSFSYTTRPRPTALLPHRFTARLHLRQWETTWGCKLTRRRCERGLLIGSAGWLVDRLARELGEVQVALGECRRVVSCDRRGQRLIEPPFVAMTSACRTRDHHRPHHGLPTIPHGPRFTA